MAEAKFSLSWDAYQKNICNGLSLLQQRGEFVDMTLAADGHHVKVHQMVLSLVSPYIKELISSAQCSHPVIFLNNISYTTLCAILEYIYTGEVNVATHKLSELIAAGKALHIKGLREMEMPEPVDPISPSNASPPKNESLINKLKEHREKKKAMQNEREIPKPVLPICRVFVDETDDDNIDGKDESVQDCETNMDMDTPEMLNSNEDDSQTNTDITRKAIFNPKLQYTISNQGGLQMIYNRYIYNFRYFGKKNQIRLWRCIDYSNKCRCPANVCTNDKNQVTTRSFTHNHPFHDNKILKKLRFGIIYSKFQEAEDLADSKKKERRVQCSD